MEGQNFFTGDYFGVGECYFGHQKCTDIIINNNNQFLIDDLIVDFPNHDDIVLNDAFFNNVIGNSADSSTAAAIDRCNSSASGSEAPFSGNISSCSFSDSQFSGVELCLPYDDVAELEWLSNFNQEPFSTVEFQNLKLIPAANKAPATDSSSSVTTPGFRRTNAQIFQKDVFVPCRSRSKRSRIAPYDWTSRILHIKQSLSKPQIKIKFKTKSKTKETTSLKTREILERSVVRCLHCGSDKTPQWRTGPMGPKTLCNACGVRYKSGRLVPEYRPANSPTYVSAKHSNSHRKVMEIRKQKEIRNAHNELVYRSFILHDDCLIDRQSGPAFMGP